MSDDELGANDPNDVKPTDGGDQPTVPPDSDVFDGDSAYDATEAALGLLSPDEAAAMLAAAEHDPGLASELADFQAVVAELARLAPPVPINRGRSAGIRSRLLTRAAASRAGRPVTRQTGPLEASAMFGAPSGAPAAAAAPASSPSRQTSPRGVPRVTGSQPAVRTERPAAERAPERVERRRHPRHWGRTLGWLAAAATVITAAGIFALWRERNVREPAAVATAPAPAVANPLVTTVMHLRAELAQRDSTIASMMSPNTRVIELASYSPPAPSARVFWDQKTQRWTLCVNGLKQPATGRTYQMWIIARGKPQPMSAGTFMPDSVGWALMSATAPVMPGRLRRVAITEEPDGGSEYPTGPILFAGK